MPGIPDDSTDSGPLRKPDGWELACAGILRTEFGRRKFNAVAGAMAKLLEDERGHEVPPAGYRWLPWPSPTAWLSLPRLAFAALAICAVLFAAGLLWHGLLKRRLAPVPVCVVSAELNCKWMPGSGHPKIGEAVPGGVLQLESGVMELAFLSKASAVIEGPARFSVAANAMKLQWGTMSAFVRQPARGFSVQMPVATLIDLGTRFGAVVNMDQTARVDVFQGAVRLASNAGGRATHELRQQRGAQIAADGMITEGPAESQGMYPQLSVTREIHPADCGLNKLGRIQPGQIPSHFGCWSGPACEITGPVENIKPIEGPGMLRFLAPGPGKDSDAWQLIDLQRDRKWLGRGGVKIRASAWFNRVSGAGAGNKFVLAIYAFHGRPEDAPYLWAHRKELAVAIARQELSDDQPGKWREAKVSAPLPPAADFLLLNLRAVASPASSPDPFPGHFADWVNCSLYTPPSASRPPP